MLEKNHSDTCGLLKLGAVEIKTDARAAQKSPGIDLEGCRCDFGRMDLAIFTAVEQAVL